MPVKKYGFVYVWYNRWKKKFYVGCHWGSENDGYVCSSKLMREAYKRNPEYFKRRVIQRHHGTRQELLEIEHRWLQLIADVDLGNKYYNLSKKHFGHWTTSPDSRSVAQKIKDAPGRKEKIAKAATGRKHSEATKAKIRAARAKQIIAPETKEKIRKANLKREYGPDFRETMRQVALSRTPEQLQKFRMAGTATKVQKNSS